MRVLLAGATGLVGSQVLQRLLADTRCTAVVAPVRRPLPLQHPRLSAPLLDFDAPPLQAPWWQVDAAICTLGSTLKQAGSRQAFARIDHGYPLAIARAVKMHGCTVFALNSAMGANPRSRLFYNRVKGELEAALQAQDWPQLTIVRPSLLLGPRREFRLGERLAAPLMRWIPGKYRGIEAAVLARALWRLALEEGEGTRIVESDELRRLGR